MITYPKYLYLPDDYIRERVAQFLSEDCPNGDITALPIFTADSISTAEIIAEEPLIFAGRDIIRVMFDGGFTLNLFANDGESADNGSILATIKGSTSEILLRERVLLNLLQRLCGIATLTKKYAEIAYQYKVKILDTRKTTPGLRLFEKFAVAAGGGSNHRLDLSSGILIKDNHITAAGGVIPAVEKLKSAGYVFPIELEVESSAQILDGLKAGVDGFLLDNMPPEQIAESLKMIRNSPAGKNIFVEASGGITLENLDDYVKTGVDAISIGALTHSAKASKIHLEFV